MVLLLAKLTQYLHLSLLHTQSTLCGHQTEGSAMRCGLLRQRTCGPYGIAARKAYPVLASIFSLPLPSIQTRSSHHKEKGAELKHDFRASVGTSLSSLVCSTAGDDFLGGVE